MTALDRSGWHPKARAALAELSDAEVPRSRSELLAISGIGEKSVEPILASLGAASAPPAGAPEGRPPSAAPPGPPSNGNGHQPHQLYPAAAALFPHLLEQAGGKAPYAAREAIESARTMGAGEALILEHAHRLLLAYCQAGIRPTEQDARECVRLARAQQAELVEPTRSPYDEPAEGLAQEI